MSIMKTPITGQLLKEMGFKEAKGSLNPVFYELSLCYEDNSMLDGQRSIITIANYGSEWWLMNYTFYPEDSGCYGSIYDDKKCELRSLFDVINAISNFSFKMGDKFRSETIRKAMNSNW